MRWSGMFSHWKMGTNLLWTIFLFWYTFKIGCISIRVSNPFIHWTKYLGPHHHYLFLPLFLGHEFSIHFRQNLFAMRSPAYGPNLAIWGSTPKNGLICEENLSQFQGNVQSCPKRLRHRWQNEICKYTGDILVFSASLSSTRRHLYTQRYILTIFLPVTDTVNYVPKQRKLDSILKLTIFLYVLSPI